MNEVEAVKTGDILDDRYELTEVVGRGGCGIVFRATDLNLEREIAVKVLCSDGACTHEMLDRFERESQILRRLHAPNTVFFYDTGQTPRGMPYIAMEFVRGKQLKVLLDETHTLSPETTVPILIQVLQSLAEAHGYGFVHRDLKPANIMLCDRIGFPGYFVKVLDFGVAKIISEDESRETATVSDNMAGTPRYMAPEQFKNAPLTPSADLYSMGCIAYEMLTGIAPFDGDTIHVTVAKHLFMTPKSLGEAFDAYPNLEAVIFKLLEKQPENRFESAQDVIDVLEHWQEPVLLPQLQNCRIHGDDNADSAFLADGGDLLTAAALGNAPGANKPDDCQAVTGAYEAPSIAPGVYPAPGEVSHSNADAYGGYVSHYEPAVPHQNHPEKIVAIAVSAIVGVLLIVGFVAGYQAYRGSNDVDEAADAVLNEPDADALPATAPVKRQMSSKLKHYYINVMTDELSQATLMGLGFGALTKLEIDGLSSDFGASAVAADEAEKNEQIAKKDDKSKRKKHKRKKPQAAQKPDLPPGEMDRFTFNVHYSPAKARVGFLNAMGQCKDGLCQVRTTSAKHRPRIIVSAHGYEPQSLEVTKPVSDLRIDLVPED